MSQFHFRPDDYLDLMHAEVPAFEELQDQVALAADGVEVTRILELGTGTGETSTRVLRNYPEARLTGIDVSEPMLAAARQALPSNQLDQLLVQSIEDPLPQGPFDLAISALTIHHLEDAGKADLFQRLAVVLRRGGRFVMADVVVPEDPADAITPLSPGYDMPSSVDDLLQWLRSAAFEPHVVWSSQDLAVFRCDLP